MRRWSKARLKAEFAALLLIASGARIAQGHRIEDPKRLTLEIAPTELRVIHEYDVEAGPKARELRQLFDRDASGALEDHERAALIRFLVRTATLFFRIELAGEPLPLDSAEPGVYGLDRAVQADTDFGLRLVRTAELPPDPSLALALVDRNPDQDRAVPVLTRIDPAFRVEFAAPGEWYPRMHTLAATRLDPQTSLTLRLQLRTSTPAAPAPGPR